MDHRFSKSQYFTTCAITFFYVGLLSASYFDITTCPHSQGRPPARPGASQAGGGGVHLAACADGGTACSDRSADSMRSLLAALRQGTDGLTCHMLDIAIWIYILGLIIFMGHKYYTYRLQGLHYFFLDYCYFHSATLVLFLLWRLVDVRWSDTPLVSWGPYLPASWGSHNYTRESRRARQHGGVGDGLGAQDGFFQHPMLTASAQSRGDVARQAVVAAAKGSAASFPDGLYYPVSLDILTTSYVTSTMDATEVLSSFVVFFTLLAGSFGPILGAIIMWKNALLFHSFDKMSSCYLHLLPATIQGMLLHGVFTAVGRELASFSPNELFERATKLAARFDEPLEAFLPRAAVATMAKMAASPAGRGLTQQELFAKFAKKHPVEAFCGEGTMCHELSSNVTFWGLLRLHFFMFLAWEMVYNVFSEVRRSQRMHKEWQRQVKELAARRAEFMKLTGSTEEEAELLIPAITLSNSTSGDPSQRVTAYTWMMNHPPGGKSGFLYRLCTCFGTGRLPTTIMFQVTQWLLHMVFFTTSYPIMYLSFHVFLSARPLLLYVICFTLLTVYNAACVNKKWLKKLQMMADKGMESERQRLSFSAPPGEESSKKGS